MQQGYTKREDSLQGTATANVKLSIADQVGK